jgi:hypothetical protein
MNDYMGEYYADADSYYPGDEEDETVTDANPTLAERAAEDGITLTLAVDYDLTGERDKFLPRGHHYIATLTREDRTLTTQYSTGSGWTREPTADDVLESLLSDASLVESTNSSEEWADDLGYDTDSRSAERAYTACRGIRDDLMTFLGERYEAYMWETDNS